VQGGRLPARDGCRAKPPGERPSGGRLIASGPISAMTLAGSRTTNAQGESDHGSFALRRQRGELSATLVPSAVFSTAVSRISASTTSIRQHRVAKATGLRRRNDSPAVRPDHSVAQSCRGDDLSVAAACSSASQPRHSDQLVAGSMLCSRKCARPRSRKPLTAPRVCR